MLNEGACPLIMGQWGVQCSTGTMCHKHEPSADNGIASRISTSPEATSLKRQVILLNVILAAYTRIGCDADHSRL
jgi:hypothetical protein